jgi:hypothetical protein
VPLKGQWLVHDACILHQHKAHTIYMSIALQADQKAEREMHRMREKEERDRKREEAKMMKRYPIDDTQVNFGVERSGTDPLDAI